LVAHVEEHGGRTTNLRTGNRPGFSDLGALASLARLARSVRPEVIHSHSSKAGALARTLPLFGIRAAQIYTPHAYWGMKPNRGRLDFFYDAVERALGRVGHTFVLSAGENSFALRNLKLPPPRVHLLQNGVDTKLFSPVPPEVKRRLREELGLPATDSVLGFIGRSSAQKDPSTLYRAFAKAAAAGPISLFHVGQGELDSELDRIVGESGIRGRVFRRRYMTNPVDFYRVVDGFILTSRYEGLSLAALEAMSCDLPMILSEAPGNLDLLALPLSHSWKAPPGDIEGFARAIAAWRDRIAQAQPINHRQTALKNFEVREKLSEVLEWYRALAEAALGGKGPSKSAFRHRDDVAGQYHEG
jgi:glycosyltransferase involved in cell wall biosynthesis